MNFIHYLLSFLVGKNNFFYSELIGLWLQMEHYIWLIATLSLVNIIHYLCIFCYMLLNIALQNIMLV